jgi:hypothetical protein
MNIKKISSMALLLLLLEIKNKDEIYGSVADNY